MKKCNICGLSFSDKVYPIHRERCKKLNSSKPKKVEKIEKTEKIDREKAEKIDSEKAIRDKAKKLGIKSYHNKKIDNLKKEIAEIENEVI